MSAFDIEKAMAGEPVERIYGAGWQQVEFVAQWNELEAICRVPEYDNPQLVPLECLRMAPKKVKVRYRVAVFGAEGRYWPVIVKDEAHAENTNCNTYFVSWAHQGWQEAEVEQ